VNVYPTLVALRRHKAAVILIVLQIALTLAIVANAFSVIGHTIEQMSRPTGVEEQGLIYILQKLTVPSGGDDAATIENIDAQQRTDLETLRNLPAVQQVAATTSIPPFNGENGAGYVSLDADRKGKFVRAAYYYGDEHLRATFGLHLIAGRDFVATEIQHGHVGPGSSVVIVSKPIAEQLFPGGDALGQKVYQDGKPATIVGIVERLQTPMSADSDSGGAFNSVIEPLRADVRWPRYVVRARAGRSAEAIQDIRRALFAVNPIRHMPEPAGIHLLSEARARYFAQDRGIAVLMSVICVILLSVTGSGIVGLSSLWVGQRTRQIGVRRAIGARKIDILRYFQIENLLIAGAGALVGTLFAFGLSEWLMRHYEIVRLPPFYVAIGIVAMLVLGQAAVLVPARRASNVPPFVAARSG
jgi:putative ABC transport system permease protein